jgi:VIT1/CCC1 family predicted Fe2+/Mn2+ transporter
VTEEPEAEKFHLQGGELIKEITFGANDGIVSVFALLAGVAGAGQSPQTILIALLAATIAGALSMAAGEFISAKGEHEYYAHEIEQERLEIALTPEIEKEEIRLIYKRKGFSGDLLDKVVDQIVQDEDRWVREMVVDELGITDLDQTPSLKTSFIIFFAFIMGALFPVLPYAILFQAAIDPLVLFWIATGVTFGGLFLAGSLKTFVTGVNWLKSGVEMLIVGIFAFGVSYLIGTIIPI